MRLPLDLVFRNMRPSKAIETRIQRHVDKLGQFYGRLNGCRVVVESPHHHSKKGNRYHVLVELVVPKKTLIVDRDPSQRQDHENVYVAIRDAFGAARRQLQAYAEQHS